MCNNLLVEALYKERDVRLKEIEFHSQRYHRHVGYVQTYLLALSSLASYIYLTNNEFFVGCKNQEEVSFVLLLLSAFLFFLHSTMLDTLYMLKLNSSSMVALDKRLNNELKDNVFIWETKIIPFGLSNQWWVVDGALRPQVLVFFWTTILFVASISMLAYFSWSYARTYFYFYAPFIVFFSIFQLYQWVKWMLDGGGFLADSVMNFFESNSFSQKNYDTDLNRYIVFVVTILLGFFSFSILSLQSGLFFPTDINPFGLMSLPTVYLGDLLILPFINVVVYDLFKSGLRVSKLYLFLSFVLSLFISSYLHYVWVNDVYTGFMDIVVGELTIAGYWHYFFSIFQMVVFLVGIYFVFCSIKSKNSYMLKLSSLFVVLFFVFSLFSILDVLFRVYYLNINLFGYGDFMLIFLSVVLLFYFKIKTV